MLYFLFMAYRERFYRHISGNKKLARFTVACKESDLLIFAESNLQVLADKTLAFHRQALEQYIESHPEFYYSLLPLSVEETAPKIVRLMSQASIRGGVGPMASVAGAIAELVGERLSEKSATVIIENGGDLFLKSAEERVIGLFSGKRVPLNLGICIAPESTPLGIATSSGKIGNSYSMGDADSVTALSPSSADADAFATYFANITKEKEDLSRVEAEAPRTPGLLGILVVIKGLFFIWGDINLVKL